MAFNNWEKFVEEYNKQNPGALPEDAATRMSALTPPEVPAIDPSNYEVNISDDTVKMNGDPRSLPSAAALGSPSIDPIKHDYTVEEDIPEAAPQPAKSQPDVPKARIEESKDSDLEKVLDVNEKDSETRKAGMADLEKKRKLGIIPQVMAGVGDSISATASAFGGNAPGGSMQRLVERQDKNLEQGKKDIETNLRNDPNSDISKQYQDLVARFMQKDPKDPMLLGLTANQIAEKIPQIEKLAKMRQDDEFKRMEMSTKAEKDKDASTAQKAVDKAFAKTYEDFIVSGGYSKAIGNLQNLVDLSGRLESGKENLTGPGMGRTPEMFRPTSVAARQEAERVIQEGLRATLGAQFTEREGERFLARSYDEKLPEKMNAKKLKEAAQTLQSMIRAKKQAADYYEENGTLMGYKGKLYTVKDGMMTEASPQEMESILSQPITQKKEQRGPRQSRGGYSYQVEG